MRGSDHHNPWTGGHVHSSVESRVVGCISSTMPEYMLNYQLKRIEELKCSSSNNNASRLLAGLMLTHRKHKCMHCRYSPNTDCLRSSPIGKAYGLYMVKGFGMRSYWQIYCDYKAQSDSLSFEYRKEKVTTLLSSFRRPRSSIRIVHLHVKTCCLNYSSCKVCRRGVQTCSESCTIGDLQATC